MKNYTLTLLLLLSLTTLFAQVPQKMSYQSVIRKTDGTLLVNTLVGIKISILQGTAGGTAVYVETQTPTTNANGLATLAIGGGTPVTGTFAGIDWSTGTYFIKTETDPVGGTNYTISGTSQLLSVPYALYAGSSQNKGKTSIMIYGNVTDSQADAQIAAEAGPYTENITIEDTTTLTKVDLSAITNLMTCYIVNNKALSSINLSSLKFNYFDLYLYGNAFPSSQINAILHNLLTIPTASRNKSIRLENQTPPAPPTGQGIIDKAALISAGWSVGTD